MVQRHADVHTIRITHAKRRRKGAGTDEAQMTEFGRLGQSRGAAGVDVEQRVRQLQACVRCAS